VLDRFAQRRSHLELVISENRRKEELCHLASPRLRKWR
jgi:hypothetical protein